MSNMSIVQQEWGPQKVQQEWGPQKVQQEWGPQKVQQEWGPQKVQQELKMAIPMQGTVSDGPPGARAPIHRCVLRQPPRHDFTLDLLEQKILLITGFTHIRLETLGSVEISAVNQQTPKEGHVCSEKFTGELIPNVPTVVAYHC